MTATAIAWIVAHPVEVGAVVLSVLSAVAEAFGWTRVSKVLGTLTLDSGRVVRYARLLGEANRALRGKP